MNFQLNNFIPRTIMPVQLQYYRWQVYRLIPFYVQAYKIHTGFYSFTDMPAAFQKMMDYTLVGLKSTGCFLDDIIIDIRGSKENHLKLV